MLEGQTPERRDFLLRTAILGRLSGPLCDAVTQTTGSARVLAELERSNLFLVPLDNRREWYRYHHLFGELLRHELALAGPARSPACTGGPPPGTWRQAPSTRRSATRRPAATSTGRPT